MSTQYLRGVRVDNMVTAEALAAVDSLMARADGKGCAQVVFVNVHSIHLARRDPGMLNCINNADLVLPDGSGLMLASRIAGHPIRENLNGTDFTPRVLALAAAGGKSVYLLGSRPHVLDSCQRRIQREHPGIRIAGSYHGHFPPEEEERIVGAINRARPDILLVAMGSPLQEKFIAQYAPRLAVRICFGVGGLFDFLSGERVRAPLWMRRLGIEWVFRFVQDPFSKWERVLVEIPLFLLSIVVNDVRLLLRRGDTHLRGDNETHQRRGKPAPHQSAAVPNNR